MSVSSGQMEVNTWSSGRIAFYRGTTQTAVIDAGGSLGIGTATPLSRLHVETSSISNGNILTLRNSANWGTPMMTSIAIRDGSNDVGAIGWRYNAAGTTVDMHIHSLYNSAYTNTNNIVMTVRGNGNVGIGTVLPTALLQVSGSGSGSLMQISSTVSSSIFFVSGSGNIGMGNTNPRANLHIGPSLNTMPASTSIAVAGDTSIRFMAGSDGNADYGSFIAGTQTAGVRALSLGYRQGAGDIVTMTITQLSSGATTGSVGIGTTTPDGVLSVQKDTNGDTPIYFTNGSGGSGNTNASITLDFRLRNGSGGSTGGVRLKVGKETDHIGTNVNDYFAISTTANDTMVERMRITSAGNVQIDNGQLNSPKSLSFQANSSAGGNLGSIDWYNFQWDGILRAQIKGSTDSALSNGRLEFWTSTVERVRIGAIGNLANIIGASDANSKIYLNQINADAGLIPVPAGTTLYLYSRSGGTNYRVLQTSSTYFTGQHGNKPIDEELKTNIQNYIGYIVSSAGSYYSVNPVTQEVTTGSAAITISEALPEIVLTTTDMDKSVWGVVTNVKNDNYNTNGTIDYDNDTEWGDRLGSSVIRINGLGEGAIWVTNINGNIENGDYICSSIVPGHGRKQNDDLLHNYTVAKSTMNCNFDLNNNGLYQCEEFEYEGTTYKKAFIGCTYHCS
jgi:hypothetical protein